MVASILRKFTAFQDVCYTLQKRCSSSSSQNPTSVTHLHMKKLKAHGYLQNEAGIETQSLQKLLTLIPHHNAFFVFTELIFK